VRVDQKGLVCVRQNRYSGPIALAGRRVRHGASDAARQMIGVLVLCRDLGAARVELAARGALLGGSGR